MTTLLTSAQHLVLRMVAEGLGPEATNPQRLSARALASRGLIVIRGRGPEWTAKLTDAGRHVLDHDAYPPGHPRRVASDKRAVERAERALARSQPQTRPATASPKQAPEPRPVKKREPDVVVASPAEHRRRGRRPTGDELFDAQNPDPYDEKILITVKEAAWMLSLPESTVRQAAIDGDLQRVFIGTGTTHYRVVYGSVLAWVDAMPRDPGGRRWWR